MNQINWILIIVIAFLLIMFFGINCYSNQFKNLMYSYKLPILGEVPNLQNSTLPRKVKYSSSEPSSSEPSSSEPSSSEPSSFNLDQSILIKTLYANERKNMGIENNLRNRKVIDEDYQENLIYRLENASNSMYLN